MAVRLPLIVSQPARRDAEAIDLIETIVAAALLVPGLDANLIGDIGSFELGGTDHLCLQGHTRELVLASFLEQADAQAAWHRLGQGGHFVDLGSSEQELRSSLQAAGGRRRVFYFQLRLGQPASALLDRAEKLLAAQQLSLVGISLGRAATPAASLPVVGSIGPKTPPPVGRDPGGRVPPARSAGLPVVAAQTSQPDAPAANASSQVTAEEDQRQWSELDKLVDDLGAMDL